MKKMAVVRIVRANVIIVLFVRRVISYTLERAFFLRLRKKVVVREKTKGRILSRIPR